MREFVGRAVRMLRSPIPAPARVTTFAPRRRQPHAIAAHHEFRVGQHANGGIDPEAAATASGLAELGGGVALAAGLFTRPAALAVAFNMGVASYKAHWKNGFYGQGGYEFSLLLGTVALSLFLTGPGRLSVDRLLSK